MSIKQVTVEVHDPRNKSSGKYEVTFEMDPRPRALRVERLNIVSKNGESYRRKISLDSDIGVSAVRTARGLV